MQQNKGLGACSIVIFGLESCIIVIDLVVLVMYIYRYCVIDTVVAAFQGPLTV